MTTSTTLYRGDAVAQSFVVDVGLYPNGLFLTSIDLFFYSKDTTLPFFLEIREVAGGLPVSNEALPFSEVVKYPGSINIPSDLNDIDVIAAASTTFTFTSPVHVAPGEYAIIMHSNSDSYALYTAQLGETVLGKSSVISQQPYVGSFFKSQNASTWTADQNVDLMFNLKKAAFTTNTDYSAIFKNHALDMTKQISVSNTGAPILLSSLYNGTGGNAYYDHWQFNVNNIQFDSNSKIVFDHKTTPLSTNTLATSFTTFIENQDLAFDNRRVLNANGSITIRGTLNTNDANISPVIDTSRLSAYLVANYYNNASLANNHISITSSGANYNSAPTVTVSAPTGSGGSVATAVAQISSNAVSNIYFTSGGSGYIETPTITLSGGNTTSTVATAVVNGETDKSGGNIYSRYITRRVTLEDGFDASSIRVYFDGYRPSTGNFAVYYKVINNEDNDEFDQRPYTLMSAAKSVVSATKPNEFKEYQYNSDDPIVYTSNDGAVFNTFKTFAIKICMYGSEPTNVPRIRNLRVIAVD
jgi:hypothetical protein